MVAELVEGMKRVVANQEKLMEQQQKQALALGEAGLSLIDHTQNLRNLGAAVVRLWHEAGLPINEAPPSTIQ